MYLCVFYIYIGRSRYLGYCDDEDTRLWQATPATDARDPGDRKDNLPVFVLREAEVLRGRGGKLNGPHVGQPVAFELPSGSNTMQGPYHAVVTAYYPPADGSGAEGELWSVRYDEDDDMADVSEDELCAALDLRRRLEHAASGIGQVNLRDKMLQEEEEEDDAARLGAAKSSQSSQSSLESFTLSPPDGGSAAAPENTAESDTDVAAPGSQERERQRETERPPSRIVPSSQDCFPSAG